MEEQQISEVRSTEMNAEAVQQDPTAGIPLPDPPAYILTKEVKPVRKISKKTSVILIISAVILLIVVLLVVLKITGHNKLTASETKTSNEIISYTNLIEGFTMNQPIGWKVDESGDGGTLVSFANPNPDRHGTITYTSHIEISKNNYGATAEADVEKVMKSGEKQIKAATKDYVLIEDKPLEVNGMKGYWAEFSFTSDGIKYHNAQLLLAKGGTLYLLDGVTIEPAWNKYSSLFRDCMTSVRFTK